MRIYKSTTCIIQEAIMKIDSGRMLNDYIQPNKKQYCIPVFQRDYAWTSEQCEKLFEDIKLAYQKDRLHF